MESRRRQGIDGERSAPFGKVVQGSLQVVEPLSLFAFALPLLIPLDGVHAVHRGDEPGRLTAAPILAGDATASPHGSVEVGTAVAVDDCHGVLRPLACPG